MASTYVNDLRLEEMATGDQSGTWGDTTNTNLELIAEAFSYGTEASFSSDADATTTIADGASDPARSLYLKVTSGASLTATRTLTIAPNTVSKIWIIENATSGSQSINISQGSGANVTIPNGDVKVIYTDGAGAGAEVVDAFTDLNLSGTTKVTGLTTTGDINFGDSDKAVFGASSDLQIYHNGNNSFIDELGTGILYIRAATDLRLTNANASKIYANFEDGGASKLYYDGDLKLLTSSTGIDVTGEVQADTLDIDGIADISSTLSTGAILNVRPATATGAATIKLGNTRAGDGNSYLDFFSDSTGTYNLRLIRNAGVNGNSILNHAGTGSLTIKTQDAGDITFQTNNAEVARFDTSGNFGIGTTSPLEPLHVEQTNADIILKSTSDSGNSRIYFGDPTNNTIGQILYVHADNSLRTVVNGTERMRIDSSGNVGIGTDTPLAKFHTKKDGTGQIIALFSSDLGTNDRNMGILSPASDSTTAPFEFSTANSFQFTIDGGAALNIASDKSVGIGTTSPAALLEVEGSNDTGDGIRVGTSSSLSTASTTIALQTNNADRVAIKATRESSTGGKLTFETKDVGGSLTEKMVIKNDGNVGIGETSPDELLTIGGDIKIKSTNKLHFTNTSDQAYIHAPASNTIAFGTNSSERMRIDSSGNVGIGTNSPSTELEVNGGIKSTDLDVQGDTARIQIRTDDPNDTELYFWTRNTADTAIFQSSIKGIVDGGMAFGTVNIANTDTTERMRIDASGNVIIGGTAPLGSATFTVDSDSAAISVFDSSAASGGYLQFRNNNTAKGVLGFGSNAGASSTDSIILGSTSGNLEFHANNAEKMRIDSSGRLLLGTTSSVAASGTIVPLGYRGREGTGGTETNNFNIAWTGSVANLWIDTTNLGAISTSSDYRIKRNVETQTDNALSRVMKIRPVTYQINNYEELFKVEEGDKIREGFIAHELAEIIPSAVEGEKDDPNQIQSLKLDALVSVLTKAIQEQQAQIEALQSEINLLKGE